MEEHKRNVEKDCGK